MQKSAPKFLIYFMMVVTALAAIDPFGYWSRLHHCLVFRHGFWFLFFFLSLYCYRESGGEDDGRGMVWLLRRCFELIIVFKGPSWAGLGAIADAHIRREWLAFMVFAKGYALLSLSYAWLSLLKRSPTRAGEATETASE